MDIKIFVSHRIDTNSELVDNPLYVPVRCGAVFDPENPHGIAGDDTGEHISEKRSSVSEFTVQYWAWKNAEADYYGLCHYRRYLSFASEQFPEDDFGFVTSLRLHRESARRYGLLNEKKMAETIRKYDLVLGKSAQISRQPTPKGKVSTVRELWEAHDGLFIVSEAIDVMFDLIDRLAPAYSDSAREYFAGGAHRGYNCYVMRRELFVRLCEFQFPILFEMERWLSGTPHQKDFPRIPGYVGEMLYGIFTYHVITREQWKVKELQMVLFKNTVHVERSAELVSMYARYGADKCVRAVADLVLPKGSRRRLVVKSYWHRLKNRKK